MGEQIGRAAAGRGRRGEGEGTRSPGHPGWFVYPGRHPSVSADTSVDLAGVKTATVMFHASDKEQAAVVVHECFHVYQAQKHPSWTANELSLFSCPTDNVRELALSRLELEAMHRALADRTPQCWAARVRAIREQRFALLTADSIAYECGTELHEGLAQYIQDSAEGNSEVKFRVFGPEEVRLRGYISGEALARILDHTDPAWKSKIKNSLDQLLPADAQPACDFTTGEKQAAEEQARVDVQQLQHQRAEGAQIFDSQPGWRVLVNSSDSNPLRVEGYDPLFFARLSGRSMLQKRYIKLGNNSGWLEVMNHGSIIESAGTNPILDGVSQWRTAGLSAQPELKQDGSKLTLSSPMLNLRFSHAQVEMNSESKIITIRLP